MDSYYTVPGEYAGPRNVGSGSYNSNFYRRLIAAALSVSMLLPASGLEAKVSNPLSSEPKAGVSRKISDSNIPTGYITLKGPDGKIIVSKEIVPSDNLTIMPSKTRIYLNFTQLGGLPKYQIITVFSNI